jgi:hypothetical protein
MDKQLYNMIKLRDYILMLYANKTLKDSVQTYVNHRIYFIPKEQCMDVTPQPYILYANNPLGGSVWM